MSVPPGGFENWGNVDPPVAGQVEGNFYFNTVSLAWRVFHNGAWQNIPSTGAPAPPPGATSALFARLTYTGNALPNSNVMNIPFTPKTIVITVLAANNGGEQYVLWYDSVSNFLIDSVNFETYSGSTVLGTGTLDVGVLDTIVHGKFSSVDFNQLNHNYVMLIFG